jgi:nucleoside-diphosphate-sugar epimerase
LIFDYYIKSNAEKFIFFSSVKAAADTVKGEYLIEEIIPEPLTPYGKSKLAAEEYILSKSVAANKKVYILRPCMIHGEGNKGNLILLYNFVKKGLQYPLGKFENLRSFTSIDNLLYILENLIDRENITSGIYNIADDDTISSNNLIKLIARSMGKKEKILYINKSLVKLAALFSNKLNLSFNSETLKKLTDSYVVSNKKIKDAIGVNMLPVNAEVGMMKNLRSFNP